MLYSNRTKNIRLSPIKQMEILAAQIPDVVSLAQGIPSFDTPFIIKKAAEKALNRGAVAKYSLTLGLSELREAIEQKLAQDKIYFDFEKEIIATAGSIEGITASLMAILNEGDEVILPSPSYTSYQEVIKIAGGIPVFVDLNEDTGWTLDVNDIKAKITPKTKAILICNPNNPTGTIYSKEQLLEIGEIAKEKNLFILIDEVYRDFIYTDTDKSLGPRESALSLRMSALFSLAQIPELRKNVIFIFSTSKAYSMTGWRLGFLASDEDNIKEILKIHDGLVTCAPVISQYAAIAALDYCDDDVKKSKEIYIKRRDLICERLDKLKNIFSYQKPNSSYFIFPKIITPHTDSWSFCIDLLNNAHVALVPGSAFGPSGEDHVRMSFGRTEKDINETFDRLEKYFNKI